MSLRSLLAVLLLLGGAFAGCLSGEDAAPTATGGDENATINTTAPDGRSLVAFEETNATEEGVEGVDHHHDQWHGASRVVYFEQEARMAPMQALDAPGYEAQATFRPDDPQDPPLVFEGTASVEFMITNPRRAACEGEFELGGDYVCTDNYGGVPHVDDPMPPTGLKMRYKHASTTTWIDAGEIKWDEPFAIKITDPRQTDMPHATSSLWEFQVLSPNKHDTTLVFDAKADLVRGEGEIPLWPGHPNFYADASSRVVLSTKAAACDDGFGTTACLLASGETGPTTAERLISYGTRTLYVWVNITSASYPNPVTAPDNWFLYHWNASGKINTTDVFDLENHGIATTEHLWILPVDDNGMDSPYADGSRWSFQLGAAFFKARLSCYGGCAEWSAEYTIEVVATNELLPLEMYDMACLRDDYCPTPEDASGGGDSPRAAYTADELRARGHDL